MKHTMSRHEVADALYRDENAGWSFEGASALADYLEDLEQESATEIEFDRVAIRCEYSEYGSLKEAATQLIGDDWMDEVNVDAETDEADVDQALKDYFEQRTTVIEFNGGCILADY